MDAEKYPEVERTDYEGWHHKFGRGTMPVYSRNYVTEWDARCIRKKAEPEGKSWFCFFNISCLMKDGSIC